MIQKKSLKDAIQNPEIISVVGGLFIHSIQKYIKPAKRYSRWNSHILED